MGNPEQGREGRGDQAPYCYSRDIRDFNKQRQRGRRRERHKIRGKPKGPLRMTGGKRVSFGPDVSGAHFSLSQNVSFSFRFLCCVNTK